MRRINKKATPPAKLAEFVRARPHADWDEFRKKPGRYQQVVKQLKQDQQGLCAYCEIELREATGDGTVADMRVEHFHPQKPHNPPPNWALDWQNLLACCQGGSARDVVDAGQRFTAPDLSCDAAKGDADLSALILNPLTDIPHAPIWFEYRESTGEIVPGAECPPEWQQKAQDTIQYLRLNAPRLLRLRRAVLEGLSEKLSAMLESGMELEESLSQLAKALFVTNQPPAFFTCVRGYLGQAAEQRLQDFASQP